MKTTPCILLVEDNPEAALLYQVYLREENCELTHVDTGGAALNFINQRTPDVVLLDLGLPDMNGMDVLAHIHREKIPTAVVIVTAHGSVDLAVKAMQYNALDFLEKPFSGKRLIVTLRNALQHQHLARLVSFYQESDRTEYEGFIGGSLSMQAVYRTIESIATSKAPAFITGESGTGKELCALAIHRQSARAAQPFITINCAAIPKDLMESEIFGHVKGAFTGALNNRQGAASLADGGTLFLDEIGELSLELQSKLLRFVQSGSLQKVGGSTVETVDVRFICATNRDPQNQIKNGLFREDLYYRLHVLPVTLPPLRERESDVMLIARHFLNLYNKEESKQFEDFAPDVEVLLGSYPWPGNVRELQNVIRNCVVLNEGEQIMAEMLPSAIRYGIAEPLSKLDKGLLNNHMDILPGMNTGVHAALDKRIQPLEDVERFYIERAIELCDGNISQSAKYLAINPSTIYRKLQQWRDKP